MAKIFAAIGVFIISIFAAAYYSFNYNKENMIPNSSPLATISSTSFPVDYQARFEIYTNGTKRIFTNAMYHDLDQNVFLEASDPSIVHIKRSGITWQDFFDTLPMTLTKDCLVTGTGQQFCNDNSGRLTFTLNGEQNPSALDRIINKDDFLQVRYE